MDGNNSENYINILVICLNKEENINKLRQPDIKKI